MNDLDELTQYLHSRADAADLGHTPLGVITRAGTRRRNRRRAATTASVLAAGTLTAGATIQVLSNTDSPRRVSTNPIDTEPGPTHPTAPPDTASETPAPMASAPSTPPSTDDGQPLALVESPLVWNAIAVGSPEAVSSFGVVGDPLAAIEQSDGSLAQVSSSPGRSPTHMPMLYRSTDGISWNADPPAIFDGRLSPLAVDGDRLYTVSSGSGTAGLSAEKNEYFAVSSTDGGATWTSARLDIDTDAWAAEPGVRAAGLHSRTAATNGQDVVLAGIASVLADQYTYAARLGLDVATLSTNYADGGVIVRETTAIDCGELGPLYEAAEEAAGDGSVTPPGTRLEDGTCVQWGAETGRYSPADLGLPGEAAAAINGLPVLFHSSNGSDFARVALPALPEGFASVQLRLARGPAGFMLVIGGSVTATGEIQSVLTYSSPDGRVWTALPDVPSNSCGIAQIGFIGDQPVLSDNGCIGDTGVFVLRDGAWIGVDTADAIAPDVSTVSLAAVGDGGVAILTRAGRPAASPVDSSEGRFEEDSLRWLLLYSPDGTSWSKTELSDITDITNPRVTALRVTDTNVLVSITPSPTDAAADAPLPASTVLVGTLG